MTLLSKNVAMKPKAADSQCEPVFSKQSVKMAINRTLASKKSPEGGMDAYARGTVLVNNLNSAHRNPVPNVRTIVSANKNIPVPNNDLLRCKRKIHFISGQSYPGAQPASVARRNARERNRVKQVNNGFATLRSHIPPAVAAALTSDKSSPRNSSASKKLSKVETLKMAVEYIRSLQQMLDDHNNSLTDTIDAVPYDNHFEIDENYYSSSPDPPPTTPLDPPRLLPKLEPLEPDLYPPRATRLPDDLYLKPDTFNQHLHDHLTSEFYGARTPPKPHYPPLDHPPRRPSPPPSLTPLNPVPYPPHPFLHPRTLSPSASDPCPSPTPSFASDHSALRPPSALSAPLLPPLPPLPAPPRPSPPPTCPSPPTTTSPLSAASATSASASAAPDYDPYDSVSPEDEELLDVISWWQQSH